MPYATLPRRLFEMIEVGEVSAFMSMISVGEVMQGPLKRGLRQSAKEVKDYLLNFPNLSSEPITSRVLDVFGSDARIQWSQLETVDSLIIASALKNEVAKIISNDNHFKRTLPQEVLITFA